MTIFIPIEAEEDLEWLRTILGNSVQKLKEGGGTELHDAMLNIVRLNDAVNSVLTLQDLVDQFDELKAKEPEKPKRKRRTKAQIEEETKGLPTYCSEHTTYGAQRPPRRECEECWSAYKKLHPLEYDQARRKFERTQ